MQRNNGDFESSATVEPRQRISNIYIYLYASDKSVFIGSELARTRWTPIMLYWTLQNIRKLNKTQEQFAILSQRAV